MKKKKQTNKQTPSDSSQIKITTELKNNIINFDNTIYQTIIIFQKSSSFLE